MTIRYLVSMEDAPEFDGFKKNSTQPNTTTRHFSRQYNDKEELRRINQRLKSNDNNKKVATGIALFFVIVLVLVVVGSGLYFASTTGFVVIGDQYVKDGICAVKIKTYEQGEKEIEYVELEGSKCNYRSDCRGFLWSSGFGEKDIDRMKITCVEN